MPKYIAKRVLYMVLIFLAMSLVLFFIYELVPGDPARAELEAVKQDLTKDEYEALYKATRERMGLDKPSIVRYWIWISNMLQGDLGESIKYKKPVIDVIKSPLKTTVFINVFSVILVLGITIPLGIYSAVNKNSTSDKVIQVITVIGYSVPSFVFAILAIFLFAVKLNWFPVSGMNTPNFSGTKVAWFLDRMKHLFLPLLVMVLSSLGSMTRHVRAAMSDALSQDYITTARAKGLSEKTVIFSHAWRNALLPVITQIIGWITSVFAGSVVIETIFNINGIGKLFNEALIGKDYQLALAVQMFYIVITVVSNLIIDLSYGVVDPRVRVDQ